MPASLATSGFGCKMQIGDGGVGAGTQATLTKGTSNAQIVFGWQKAGIEGNGKDVTIVQSGNNTPLSVTVSETAITVNLETDGMGDEQSTVNDVIAELYANATFREFWFANAGAGDGTGLLQAAVEDSLAGGAAGSEVFTDIAEVKSLSGPTVQAALIDVTHMGSDNNTREFLPSLIDPGEMSFQIQLLPANAQHQDLKELVKDRTRTNFRLVFTDQAQTTWAFAGYVTQFAPTAELESALMANITIKLTSFPTEL